MTGAVLAILPYSVKYVVSRIVWLLSTIIFIAAIASWIPQVRSSQIGRVLHMLTEPIVGPVRRVLRRIPALRQLPMDFSPLVVYLLLIIIERLVWLL